MNNNIRCLKIEVVGGALDGQRIEVAVPYGIRAMATIELSEIERAMETPRDAALTAEFERRRRLLAALAEELT